MKRGNDGDRDRESDTDADRETRVYWAPEAPKSMCVLATQVENITK